MRFRSLLTAAVLLAPLAACAPESSVATTEADDTEASAVSGDTVFVVTRQDMRKCAFPMCGGVFVKAVNKAKTKCLDGTKQEECYVSAIDVDALGLSENQAADVRAAATSGQVLLSGEIAKVTPEGFPNGYGALKAFKAFQAATESEVTGSYYTLQSSGITCVKAPCPSVEAAKLNSTSIKPVTDVDFSALGLSDEQASAFLTTVFETGLVVSGKIVSKTTSLGKHKIFQVSQVFPTVEAATQQLCLADDECGAGNHCDMSVCLSNCPEGMVCPAVCYGACAAGEPAPVGGSCAQSCGGPSPDESCYCDDLCAEYGDCCADYAAVCN
jgi:hypothetical protein